MPDEFWLVEVEEPVEGTVVLLAVVAVGEPLVVAELALDALEGAAADVPGVADEVGAALEGDEDEGDEDGEGAELVEDWFWPVPESGSTYCWSPAEGPAASALAEPHKARSARASRKTMSVLLTGRRSMAGRRAGDSLLAEKRLLISYGGASEHLARAPPIHRRECDRACLRGRLQGCRIALRALRSAAS